MDPDGSSSSSFAPGESGPRRSTPQIIMTGDASAANAEAARLARQLGVSSSSSAFNAPPPRRSWFSRRNSLEQSAPAADNATNNTSSSQTVGSSSHKSHTASHYTRMSDVDLHPLDWDTAGYHVAPVSAAAPRTTDPSLSSSSELHQQQQPHLYDSHGQRAPYKEGPYYVSRAKDGRVLRRRWCE